MPYYGNDFEAATKGLSPQVKWAYLCALWHYWHHTHCQGLNDDEERLQGICETDPSNWPKIKSYLFDGTGFFIKENGKWHNSRCRELYQSTLKVYKKRCESAKKARQFNPDNKPNTKPDTMPCSCRKPEPEPEPESESYSEPESESLSAGCERPSKQEVLGYAQMIGLAEWRAEDWFQEMEGVGWIDHYKRPIRNWQSIIVRVRTKWEADGRPSGPPKNKNYPVQKRDRI